MKLRNSFIVLRVSTLARRLNPKMLLTSLGTIIILLLILWELHSRFSKGFDWPDWTGFGGYFLSTGQYQRGKTLWDWMELLIIPVVLALGTLWFSRSERLRQQELADKHTQVEREIAQDKFFETALQTYLEKISDLLLCEKLRDSLPDSEARIVARVWTLTTLKTLDGKRKGLLLKFLQEAGLIRRNNPIISLQNADFSQAIISETDFNEADLSLAILYKAECFGSDFIRAKLTGANMSEANLFECDLSEADVSEANLSNAILLNAELSDADFSGANLSQARVHKPQLSRAKYLSGTIMPDGITYETL